WCPYPPHLAKSIHIKWEVVHFTLVVSYWTICISIEFCKLVYIIPHFLIRCMENMGSILMHLNAIYFLSVDITSNMVSFFNHFYTLTTFSSFIGKSRPKKARAYY